MLGYLNVEGVGRVDDLLFALALDMQKNGVRVAGAVQENGPDRPDRKCDMDLHILASDQRVRISQDLGTGSKGCRLNATALAEAVGMVETDIASATPAHLLIVNKFGNQEYEGRGFRPAIAAALERDIPVLVGVRDAQLDGFLTWAGDLAEPVAEADLLNWCLRFAKSI